MIIKTILAAFTAATMLSACTGAPSGSSADSTQGAESTAGTADSASVSSPIEKITSEVEKLTEEITAGTSDSTKNDTAEETEMSQDVKYNNILIFLFALDTIYRILIGYVPCFQHNTNNNQQ